MSTQYFVQIFHPSILLQSSILLNTIRVWTWGILSNSHSYCFTLQITLYTLFTLYLAPLFSVTSIYWCPSPPTWEGAAVHLTWAVTEVACNADVVSVWIKASCGACTYSDIYCSTCHLWCFEVFLNFLYLGYVEIGCAFSSIFCLILKGGKGLMSTKVCNNWKISKEN